MTSRTDVFVARQAIFDRSLNVYGYELLFRSSLNNHCTKTDDTLATSQLIANSFFSIGADRILAGKKAFINFSRDLLIRERPALLPPEMMAIEILESVEPDEEVIAACRDLKARGYLLALDDFLFQGRHMPLVDLADIIKVDFLATKPAEQETLAKHYGHRRIRMQIGRAHV